MKKRGLMLLVGLLIVAILAAGAFAWFSDTETSNDNTFTAGSLNLNVNGNDGVNTVKWVRSNMVPGNQPTGTFTLNNTGSIAGYLDLQNIVVTSFENNIIEPEVEAGDTTDETGELQNVLSLHLYRDLDCNGYFGTGDVLIYSGMVKDIASNYELNYEIPAGGKVCLTGVYDWWSTADDNKAMTDSFDLDMTFELGQTTGQ